MLLTAIALGGRSGSAELRDWAARELRGYGPDDELPPYRTVGAPLHVDMMNMRWIMKGQTISPLMLPDFAQDTVTNDVPLVHGIAEIEQLARRCPPGEVVNMAPPGAAELVALMNMQQNLNGHVERLYWGVSPVALEGVVGRSARRSP